MLMADYSALQTLWATLPPDNTTDQNLAAVNAMTVAVPPVDIPASAIAGYLGRNLRLAPLIAYATAAPSGSNPAAVMIAKNLLAILQLGSPPDFQSSDPATFASLSTALGVLVSDPLSGLTSGDAAAIVALSQPTIPWSRANGYETPITADTIAAMQEA
jgi:hypothetical protein